MEDIILETRNLTFSYDEKRNAIEDITLCFKAGERVAILGENGAGKSTFFLTINGVREADSGKILLHGEEINKKNKKKLHKAVGIVFQDADSQIIASTVKAEVAFGPLNMGLSRADVEECVDRAIEKMNLSDYANRPPHYLSGGEKKRVTIADILAMDTDIVVFDEPTASLDPQSSIMLEEVLLGLKKENKTVLLSTHDIDFAYRFATRVLVFSKGKLIADDEPAAVFANEEILKAANLKKPTMLEVMELLEEKGIVEETGLDKYPKSVNELADLL